MPDEPDADRIAAAAAGQPGVARLHGGRFGEVATYLPGRSVAGIQVGEQRVAVHVVARYGSSVPDVATGVRAAAAPYAAGFPIDVVIEDIEDPPMKDADG